MKEFPEYRLRLFMSADLVGSTAFKAKKEYSGPQDGSPSPAWVHEFRSFYQQFPIAVRDAYKTTYHAIGIEHSAALEMHPRVWKTVGDEILFCSRVVSIEHAAASVSSFLKAMERYANNLEKIRIPLRLKGAGWLAAFPAPNISISIFGRDGDTTRDSAPEGGENTEAFELEADKDPGSFDFLGKGIDTGFRIAKNATEDRFVTSVQLGYVLAKASCKRRFPHPFGYHGRETLKGVIDGAPYPIISIDTERSELRAKLKSREEALTGESGIKDHALCDFLETFMDVAEIERPCLPDDGRDWSEEWPHSYLRYQSAFEANLKIDTENENQVIDSPDPQVADKDALGASEAFLEDFPKNTSEDSLDEECPASSAE